LATYGELSWLPVSFYCTLCTAVSYRVVTCDRQCLCGQNVSFEGCVDCEIALKVTSCKFKRQQ